MNLYVSVINRDLGGINLTLGAVLNVGDQHRLPERMRTSWKRGFGKLRNSDVRTALELPEFPQNAGAAGWEPVQKPRLCKVRKLATRGIKTNAALLLQFPSAELLSEPDCVQRG